MIKFAYLDKKRHGTAEFPVEYYYVDSTHPRYQMAFHWHNEWELLRVIRGELYLTLDDRQYKLGAGDTVLISGETLHGGEAVDCVYECLVFDLYGLFNKMEALRPSLRQFYCFELSPDTFFTKDDRYPSRPLDIFSQDEQNACIELETVSAIAELFAWIIKNKRYRDGTRKNGWSVRIKPVLEYIEAHYADALSLDILAGVSGMNARYFCRVFSSLTNTTPMDYVNFYRTEQAALLLDTTDMSITEISAACGFSESSYFTKVFKKYKELTPHFYRRSRRKK